MGVRSTNEDESEYASYILLYEKKKPKTISRTYTPAIITGSYTYLYIIFVLYLLYSLCINRHRCGRQRSAGYDIIVVVMISCTSIQRV